MNAMPPKPEKTAPVREIRPRRRWLGIVFVAVYWIAAITMARLETPFFFKFLFGMAAPFLLTIAMTWFWWRQTQFALLQRLGGTVFMIGCVIAAGFLSHQSVGIFTAMMSGLPIAFTAFAISYWLSPKAPPVVRPWMTAAAIVLGFSSLLVVRTEGVDGDLRPAMHLRWTPTAEERFLAAKSSGKKETPAIEKVSLTVGPEDSAGFRGTERNGAAAASFSLGDWNATPPKLIWKRKVGPAWSSMIVIGDYLFTQEQRGELETVVCYRASNGDEVWVHSDNSRFWESVSGAGPRGTPTFFDGSIYTLGAKGRLNRLDAATGERKWTVDLVEEAKAEVPGWGMSGSPLVIDGLVIVYGGGKGHDNLLAYDQEAGKRVWSAPAGDGSYASPQAAVILGKKQVLMHHDGGLTSVEPAAGKVLWTGGSPLPGAPRSLQPHVIGEDGVIAGMLFGGGIGRLKVELHNGEWKADKIWSSSKVNPEFSEGVIFEDHVYGFNGAILFCMDAKTGDVLWKKGRYGRGQMLLAPERKKLIVATEDGKLVQVAADPSAHRELGKFQAIEGKTWNHPVIAHGRIYLRNDQEMACYELTHTLQ